MSRLPRAPGDRIVAAFTRHGWTVHHQRGSHVYLRHPGHPGVQLTVPVHAGHIVKLGTLAAILSDADITAEEFTSWL
ncbi:MAG: type II toxin-antitoxin system HicA family toxin [Actinomycetota bacterium]|nr:type II toxin-antitoxin system HicA family toxin [Actinomycetota bacterium]